MSDASELAASHHYTAYLLACLKTEKHRRVEAEDALKEYKESGRSARPEQCASVELENEVWH